MKTTYLRETWFKTLPASKKLVQLYQAAIAADHSVVIWSMPGSGDFQLLIDLSGKLATGEQELESAEQGFIFSPFRNNQGANQHYMKADILYSTEDDELKVSPSLAPEKNNRLDHLLSVLQDNSFGKTRYHTGRTLQSSVHSYPELVQKGIDNIKAGAYDKLVLARNKTVELPASFDPVQTLLSLRQKYATAFCYLLSDPEHGNWMAATPELLISLDPEVFRTVALAGTARLEPGESTGDVRWTQKEIEEQAMVSRYIIDSFKKIRLREFKEQGPKTVRAGNLAHLKTSFSVNYQVVNFPELGTVMLRLLHPTSAVCGMPLEGARKFIETHEGFDRKLFSGYLGPVNVKGQTSIFVNLRTMYFTDKQALLYAGAGITEDSKAEKEYLETEMKMETLLDVIRLKAE